MTELALNFYVRGDRLKRCFVVSATPETVVQDLNLKICKKCHEVTGGTIHDPDLFQIDLPENGGDDLDEVRLTKPPLRNKRKVRDIWLGEFNPDLIHVFINPGHEFYLSIAPVTYLFPARVPIWRYTFYRGLRWNANLLFSQQKKPLRASHQRRLRIRLKAFHLFLHNLSSVRIALFYCLCAILRFCHLVQEKTAASFAVADMRPRGPSLALLASSRMETRLLFGTAGRLTRPDLLSISITTFFITLRRESTGTTHSRRRRTHTRNNSSIIHRRLTPVITLDQLYF